MGFLKRRLICLLCAMAAILFAGVAIGATPELPKGLVMNDTFKPGYGARIGKFRTVQGKVVVMHADMKEGYWAKKKMPLYKGDIIVTQKRSRTNFVMNDKSIISLSSNTKLVLTKSVYDEKKKRRSSFLGLTIGKARFIVSKLLSFKRREFKVKTVTAVCGVRGSDFIIVATDKFTEVTALENTKLAVFSLARVDAPPVIVQDFERTGVEMGQLPYETEIVPPAEIQELKKDVATPSDETVSGEQQDVQQEELSEEEDVATEETEEEGDTATEETQDSESAKSDATSEDAQSDEPAESDTPSEDAQASEPAESDATSGETQAEVPAESDPAASETQASESAGTALLAGDTDVESEPTGDQDVSGEAGVGVAATGKAVGVTPNVEDATPDATPESDVAVEGTDVGQATETAVVEAETVVDPGAVYVPEEVLVEPELPTELEQPVVDIKDIIVDVVEEPEIADLVAEQILQEDLEIPPIPGTPE